ncbi:MAG TPA: preprotein translocase subunit YajC [Nitrospirota bacterium]|nr:preprotein translocase subunit YajC [Nitrospirota bacterium]
MFIETAYAMGSQGAPGGQGAAGGISSLVMMAVIFGIFYFILIRPQQKKMKEHKKMVEELKKGDKIITAGGIYGTVVGVGTNSLKVEIADGVKVKIGRHTVGTVLTEEEAAKE